MHEFDHESASLQRIKKSSQKIKKERKKEGRKKVRYGAVLPVYMLHEINNQEVVKKVRGEWFIEIFHLEQNTGLTRSLDS